MKGVLLGILLIAILAAPVLAATCQTVASFTPTCTGGTITKDTLAGTCRTIVCSSGSSSMQAMACDKPDGKIPQYFELYKQAVSGNQVTKACLGTACVGSYGFAKSPAYTCTAACVPTTEVCDSKDNDCDALVDENNVCGPVCIPAIEVCDGKDNDCDALVDESNVCASTCYSSVTAIPATCTGATITSDVNSGSCRTIICGGKKVFACDKSGFFEMYNQGGSSAIEVCLGAGNCIKGDGYDKSPPFPICTNGGSACVPSTEICDNKDNDCDTLIDESNVCAPACTPTTEICDGKDNDCDAQVDENNVCAPPSSTYPLKTNIVSTIFWAGQGPSADTGWSQNYDSAWDVWWMEHYGGYDDPNNRNGWYPAGFTPKENPFYVAIPYTDFSTTGRKSNAFEVVPWSDEKASWGYQESLIKNRWVRITKGAKTAYAQVENAGPGPTDDWQYVFSNNPQPTTDFGWKAGIDVSPAVRDYLGLGAVDTVSWQWVDASQVPQGPWKTIVTTRQSCWASTICP